MDYTDLNVAVIDVNGWEIIWIPKEISQLLPSRGMVMIEGYINQVAFTTWLEPDGRGSHWFKIDQGIEPFNALSLSAGDKVTLKIRPLDQWLEPTIPKDLEKALLSHQLDSLWKSLTTRARWEWIRWIRSTASPKTRSTRIDKTCSKLASGMRRPCCYDQTRCSEPHVSSCGVFLPCKD